MPSRVKLLDNVGPNITGTSFKIGMGAQPFSIRIVGADAAGVVIESSPDRSEANTDATATWQTEVGLFGGSGADTALTQNMTGMLAGDIGIIQHYTRYIRARTLGTVANSTVYLEMGR